MCKYLDMTNQEWLSILSRQPALLDAARAVVEAAIGNTEAVQAWRAGAYAAQAPSQREWRATMDKVDETRAELIEVVEGYKNAKCMARLQPGLNQIPQMVEAMEAGR